MGDYNNWVQKIPTIYSYSYGYSSVAPSQTTYVRSPMQSGQITQEQFNQVVPFANMPQRFVK